MQSTKNKDDYSIQLRCKYFPSFALGFIIIVWYLGWGGVSIYSEMREKITQMSSS